MMCDECGKRETTFTHIQSGLWLCAECASAAASYLLDCPPDDNDEAAEHWRKRLDPEAAPRPERTRND